MSAGEHVSLRYNNQPTPNEMIQRMDEKKPLSDFDRDQYYAQ